MPDITREQLAKAVHALGTVTIDLNGHDLHDDPYGTLRYPDSIVDSIWEGLAVLAEAEPEPGAQPHTFAVAHKPPSYYDGKGGMQPFDVIDAFGLDFYEGNVVKYLVRWRKKNRLEDLRKARTYLNRIISRAESASS